MVPLGDGSCPVHPLWNGQSSQETPLNCRGFFFLDRQNAIGCLVPVFHFLGVDLQPPNARDDVEVLVLNCAMEVAGCLALGVLAGQGLRETSGRSRLCSLIVARWSGGSYSEHASGIVRLCIVEAERPHSSHGNVRRGARTLSQQMSGVLCGALVQDAHTRCYDLGTRQTAR